MDCVFCKIVEGTIPSYTVYEDEIAKIFLDINPDTNGHLLIIPKKHFQDLSTIDNSTLTHIMDLAKKCYQILEEKLNCDGLTLVQNNGIIQDVKHYHLHLKPFYKEEQQKLSVEEVYNKLTK
ncbi:MAG: HIT domain-containing protein [Mollicutes bacterium]|nr:HIT domain-containing protein [Mollicutes bacterium]